MSVTTPNLAAARAQDNLMALRVKAQDAGSSLIQPARGLDQAVHNLSVLIRQNCLAMPSLG
jgi:hypothetical protein